MPRKPGPKSAAELSVAPVIDASQRIRRPAPPAELEKEAADEWRAITATLPADWIKREHFPQLVAYCQHAVAARRLNALIERRFNAEPVMVDSLERLLKMRANESRLMLAAARSLRITRQAQTHPETAGRKLRGTPPWLGEVPEEFNG